MMKLGDWVRCTKISPSSNLGSKVKGQGHQGQKRKKYDMFFWSGPHPRGRELCCPPVVRRWESQRMLSNA